MSVSRCVSMCVFAFENKEKLQRILYIQYSRLFYSQQTIQKKIINHKDDPYLGGSSHAIREKYIQYYNNRTQIIFILLPYTYYAMHYAEDFVSRGRNQCVCCCFCSVFIVHSLRFLTKRNTLIV